MHSGTKIILASGSTVRQRLLKNAGVVAAAEPACINEPALKSELLRKGYSPAETSAALGERKALSVSARNPEALVIGCDQVLEFQGRLISKSSSEAEASRLLQKLSGGEHGLHSSAAVCRKGVTLWQHVDSALITMKKLSNSFIDAYVERNSRTILQSVGCYLIEAEGIRLIKRVEGDFFTVCGLPLMPLLSYLEDMDVLEH